MLTPGSILGERYRVGRPIGKGGMGVVVEATHLTLGTQVAVKILARERAQPANIERFLREARAAAQLRGEHTCRVHDFGTLPDGTPYMVMELLHGHDLATMLKGSGPLDASTLARYMLEVCTAIAEAHAAGLVHRDLKPANLMVVARPDGTPCMKVLDFGIAKSVTSGDMSLTDTTNVMGSPLYMSPEQLKSSKNVDARSDIWSLGVSMYELLSGTHPFDGETLPELAIRIANEPAPPLPSSVPAAFTAIVMCCLEKDPAKRYPNVAALARALEPLAAHTESVSGSVARVLTGSALSIGGDMTAPALPSQLATPKAGAESLISDGIPTYKETTLRGASGAVLAQAGDTPARRRGMPIVLGAMAVLTLVGIGLWQFRGHRGEPAITPATSPVASPTTAPPPTPAPVAAPTPAPTPPQAAANTVASPTPDVPAVTPDAGVDVATPASPVRPKRPKHPRPQPDFSLSRH